MPQKFYPTEKSAKYCMNIFKYMWGSIGPQFSSESKIQELQKVKKTAPDCKRTMTTSFKYYI